MTFSRRRSCVLLAVAMLVARGVQAQAGHPGTYTQEQADHGRRIYGAFCATCHGTDLEGAVGAALTGPAFAAKWSQPGRSVQDLYQILSTTMPRPAAGSLAKASYLDVLAYILSRNALAAGDRALTDSGSTLAAIQVPPPAAGTQKPAPEFVAGDHGSTPTGRGPSEADLERAESSTDWLYNTHDFSGTRHAPLRQITAANVARLQAVCAYQLGSTETFVSGPIVWQGTMYVTTPRLTVAIDAATCRERWRSSWEPLDAFLWPNSRGVAIKDGYVVRGTADGYLVALDAATGHLLWARQVAKPAAGETITMPPLIYDSLVIIGPAGSENNVQGWIGAFRLSDGAPVWKFHTIPRPGEPGAETWQNAPGLPVGGGGVWTAPSFDVSRGELYVAVTNPAPDFPVDLRPGANLYTNSVIALDVRTGTLRWYKQPAPHDSHDWDLTQANPIVRNVLFTVGKEGVLRPIDRVSHAALWETPVTTLLNVREPVTSAGVHVCPGVLGGVEWSGPAYDPAAGVVVVPAVDWCSTFKVADTVRLTPGENYLGGTVAFDSSSQGWLTAVDATSGAVRWRYRSPRPMVGSVTTTAGGLVFAGETTGDLLAFDVRTGRELYRFNTGGAIGGGVISYLAGGRQYVATTSGRAGFFFGSSGAPTVFVFALPGGAAPPR